MACTVSRFMAILCCFCCLFGCAEHRQPLDDDGLPVTDGSETGGPPGGGRGGPGGGGGGIWSDVLHTAMQTGMGFLHH